jgi:hypothetical protein
MHNQRLSHQRVMKKTLFLVVIGAIIFSSCKKEHGLTIKASSAKKYAVTFNVSNFKLSQGTFALRTKGSQLASSSDTVIDLASNIDLLYYVVLDSTLNLVKTIVHDSTYCSAMGTITDSLPAGHYYIALVAGKNGLEIGMPSVFGSYSYGYARQPWTGDFFCTPCTPGYPPAFLGLPYQDTFWNSFPLTVGAQDINLTTTLTRELSKLELTIKDPIPANADSLFISVGGPPLAALIGESSIGNTLTTFPIGIPASAKGQANFTVDRLVLGALGQPVIQSVFITCKDAEGNIIGNATVNPIVFTANQKTILSGKLFSSSAPQSFTAQIDTAWSSGVTQVGFSLKRH